MRRSALVLAGHGSHISPNTAGLVWDAVDVLRQLGIFDEVGAAFWKEQPSFATVLDSISAADVTVVPLFTAQGYFTRTVIPAEMDIDLNAPPPEPHSAMRSTATNIRRIMLTQPTPGTDTTPSARRSAPPAGAPANRVIRYTKTLGEHPRIGDIVRRRIQDAIAAIGAPPADIAMALIGHATRRNPDSRRATEAQRVLVRSTMPVREVVAVYLDDTPAIPDVYMLTTAPVLIAVPYFLAAGSHTTIDVPAALGLASGETTGTIDGRRVIYTAPIGQRDEIVEMALDLAREAGAPMHHASPRAAWDGFPQAGVQDAAALLDRVPARFGQLWVTRDEVRHIDDARRDDLPLIDTPAALRQRVREAPFRPLATAMELPTGWRVAHMGDAARLHAIIETIYPGVFGTAARVRGGGLAQDVWSAVIARQTGQYRALAAMTPDAKASVTVRVCSRCVLHPAWADGAPRDTLVCREPCNIWLSDAVATNDEE